MEHDLNPSSRSLDQKELASDEIERICDYYSREVEARATGPQAEGIETESLAEALLTDPDIYFVEIEDDNGEKIKWPLLVHIVHQIDYNLDFFERRYLSEGRDVYYLTLPPLDQVDAILGSPAILEIAKEMKRKGAVIAFDFLDEGENGEMIQTFIESMLAEDEAFVDDITPTSKFGKAGEEVDFGLPKVDHFEITAVPEVSEGSSCSSLESAIASTIEDGTIERDPDTGVAILTKDLLLQNDEKYLKQIVAMYNEQFARLTEDHPSLQKSPEEELRAMLLDRDSVNIGYIENGEVVGLTYFIQNIENAVWLNSEYYTAGEDEIVIYFPGIVVRQDKARQGLQYMPDMLEAVRSVFKRVDKKIRIVFQCTNVSREYIPDMIVAVGDVGGGISAARYDDGARYKKVAEYDYRILEVM